MSSDVAERQPGMSAGAPWRTMAFSEAAEINPRRLLPKVGDVPFLDMATLPLHGAPVQVVEKRPVASGGARFQAGDTLFARITPCAENGKLGFVSAVTGGTTAQGSTEFVVMGARDGLTLPEYVRWLSGWSFVRDHAIGLMEGTSGRQRIPAWAFDEIEVPVPPLDEQRRIAEVLRSVDEAIAAAECATQGARHVFATVRAELLEGARAECAEVLVADAIAKNRGQKITKLQTADYLDEGSFPIIDQGSSFICGFSNDANAVWPYDLPVIVFGDYTRILKFVDFPFVIGADGTQCLTPATDLDARYLYYALQSLDLRGEGYARHFKLLKERSIPVPPLVEQVQIAKQLLSLEDAIGGAEAATERLLMVKRALMSDLLSGHVRVPA